MDQPGHVQIVEAAKASLRVETAQLFRQRLQALLLITVIIMAVVFVRGLVQGDAPLTGFRAGVLLAIAALFALLRGRLSLSPRQLQWIELLFLSLLGAQITVMSSVYLVAFADQGQLVSATTVGNYIFLVWALIILGYGMLIPNHWRRAALILFPAACVPYMQSLVLSWNYPPIAAIHDANQFQLHLHLVPFLAACASVYTAHVIFSIRREAYEARQLGQYRLLEPLKKGGMGEVYKAEHRLLKRPCALKLIRPEMAGDALAIARFEREVQATARLTHWNTIAIFDYGLTSDGTFYYVMELLRGLSLAELVQKHGPMPPGRVVHFLRQTCAALAEAHGIGLIHRDLKPANIFAAILGGIHDVAKLLDFGLVKERASQSPDLTQEGKFGGSPTYMAPEQAVAFKNADARSDLYSLGVVAYYLLTGMVPFTGENAMAVIIAHASQPVVPPTQLNAAIPADLEQIILRCLEKKPADRFQDADSLRRALGACPCAHEWNDEKAAAWWRENCDRIGGP